VLTRGAVYFGSVCKREFRRSLDVTDVHDSPVTLNRARSWPPLQLFGAAAQFDESSSSKSVELPQVHQLVGHRPILKRIIPPNKSRVLLDNSSLVQPQRSRGWWSHGSAILIGQPRGSLLAQARAPHPSAKWNRLRLPRCTVLWVMLCTST
jgi:hypothetical protein